MISGLGAILDRLQASFSKGFLLAGFCPMAIFFSLNGMFGYWIFPEVRYVIARFHQLNIVEQILYGLAFSLLILLSSFVFWTINSWLRELLEGRHLLPDTVRRYLEAFQQSERQRLEDKLRRVLSDLYDLRKAKESWPDALREARKDGNATHPPDDPKPSESLMEAYRELKGLRRWRQQIPYTTLERFFQDLREELRLKPADRLPALDDLHVEFWNLTRYALGMAEREYGRLRAEQKFRFPEETATLGPTSMANMAELHRNYAFTRYGMDIDVFWLRMQKIIIADPHFFPILDQAKTQLDFAVALTWVFALFTVFWSAMIWWQRSSFVPFAMAFGLGAPATALFYWVAVRNYRTFGETLRSAVDLYRFDLLRALHLPLPTYSKAEERLWKMLTSQAELQGDSPLTYKHE
jgi:hypothetical protein